jgi:carboxypeptidase Taq
MGVHESQSRLWENIVGRSEPFCRFLLEEMDRAGIETHGLSPESLHGALNIVTPSFIRTEADEVTYNLHVCLRFKLERALIEGQLAAEDLPAVWNEEMKRLLGIDVPSDRQGVLQDVHWSCGLFGYFPTYTLGNLISAQLYAAAEETLGPQDQNFAAGLFKPLLGWLRSNIHRQGRIHPASQLVELATGQPPNAQYFLDYLEDKFGELYDL